MLYWTLGELKDKIEKELDLQEEPDILADGELVGYINDAIDACEQHFISLGDYFLSDTTISLVAGTSEYLLPDDIYATKIRKLMDNYGNGIGPLKDLGQVGYYVNSSDSTSAYRYLIINNPNQKPKFRFYPTPSRGETLSLFYTRNAYRFDPNGDDDQELDVPEAANFIVKHVKQSFYEKERSPYYQFAREDVLKQEQLLINALAARTDDESNQIEPDVDVYADHT